MQKSWCFHLSLNVARLPRSIEFYRVLFDMEPAKCHDDYAKFEVVEPPVVFSLVPHAVGAQAEPSRVGLSLSSVDQLQQLRNRFESRGIHIRTSADSETAFGVADPDGNAWQFSSGEDAPDWATTESVPQSQIATAPPQGEPIVWEHYVTAPLPSRIPHDDESVDEVRLTGTFNGPHAASDREQLILDVVRVLKPGGKVVVHGLAGDKPFPHGMPPLPGLAAMVSQVPTHHEMTEALHKTGFTGLQFVKFDKKAWFAHDGVEMREIKAIGWKPLTTANKPSLEVIYRGPFQRVRDDQGNTYLRGQRIAIAAETWIMLRESPQATQFVFLEPEQANKACQIH